MFTLPQVPQLQRDYAGRLPQHLTQLLALDSTMTTPIASPRVNGPGLTAPSPQAQTQAAPLAAATSSSSSGGSARTAGPAATAVVAVHDAEAAKANGSNSGPLHLPLSSSAAECYTPQGSPLRTAGGYDVSKQVAESPDSNYNGYYSARVSETTDEELAPEHVELYELGTQQ